MAMISRIGMVSCIAVMGMALAGGSAAAQEASGPLADYARLQPSPDNPIGKRWIDPSFNFKPYMKIMFDPVEVWVNPASQYKGASPDVLKRMSDGFLNSFRQALQPAYQVVNKPGPDVLRVKSYITGVNLVKPSANPADFVPVVFLFRAASGADAGRNIVLSAELQVLGPDGKVVAEAVASGTSDKKITESQQVTWSDLKSVSDSWGQIFRKALDGARGGGK
jgi:hypothetical protein